MKHYSMGEDQEHIERTLAVFRQVAAYTIPPRMGSGGEPLIVDCKRQSARTAQFLVYKTSLCSLQASSQENGALMVASLRVA